MPGYRSVAAPITPQETEALMPGLMDVYEKAWEKVAPLVGKKVQAHKAHKIKFPSLIICEPGMWKKFMDFATEKSPIRENSGYAALDGVNYAIYHDAEFAQLINAPQPEKREMAHRVIVEELIHAFTTRLSKGQLQAGFVRVPLPLHYEGSYTPGQIYSWKLEEDKVATDSIGRIPEDVVQIHATENMTRLLVALLCDKPAILCAFTKDMAYMQDIQKDVYKYLYRRANPDENIVDTLFSLLYAGKLKDIEKKLIFPLKQLRKKLPAMNELARIQIQLEIDTAIGIAASLTRTDIRIVDIDGL